MVLYGGSSWVWTHCLYCPADHPFRHLFVPLKKTVLWQITLWSFGPWWQMPGGTSQCFGQFSCRGWVSVCRKNSCSWMNPEIWTLSSPWPLLDNRLRARYQGWAFHTPVTPFIPPTSPIPSPSFQTLPGHSMTSSAPVTAEQPMQLGHARLTPEERHRRIGAGECLYCGRVLILQPAQSFYFGLSGLVKRLGSSVALGVLAGWESILAKLFLSESLCVGGVVLHWTRN